MFDEDIELIRPVPFQYSDDDARNIPDLDEDEFDDLTAVLKALARGSYPRLEAVPFALNAYNCDQMMINDDDERKPWAYFHPVTIVDVRMIDTKVRPRIDLDGVILEDLERDWQPIRAIDHTGSGKGGGRVGSIGQDSARYRFLCFIHKHRIDRKRSSQKVGTIPITLTASRAGAISSIFGDASKLRRGSEGTIYGTNLSIGLGIAPCIIYASASRILCGIPCRRETRFGLLVSIFISQPPFLRSLSLSIVGIALYHMNNARDPQVSIVPDRLELFGGNSKDLLPRFFVRLLCLCLDARPMWTREEQMRFVAQFRIIERLGWMKLRTREHLELSYGLVGGGGGGGGGSESGSSNRGGNKNSSGDGDGDDDSEEDVGESRRWIYDVLEI